jgi:hypothetical protein
MKKSIGIIGAAVLGLGMALSASSAAGAAGAGTIYVPQDFNPAFSDTRANGHYEVVGTGLRVYTDGNTDVGANGKNSDKVAEYVDTTTPLAGIGEPTLDQHGTGSPPPGYQLVVDLNNDGTLDGILVGEPTFYGTNWWLSAWGTVGTTGAPHTGGGFGSPYYGTLDEWRTNFPNAVVKAFGFSLGSGVLGDWVIDAINFNGTRYTFAPTTTLAGKDDCKNGGWMTSTQPFFKNQGECVSSFASKKKASAFSI